MNIDTLSMLCNPYTHEALQLMIIKSKDGKEIQCLEGIETKERFFFKNGIPVFYDDSLLDGYNLYYNSFYRKVAKFYDPALKVIAFFSGGGEAKFRNRYLKFLEIEAGSKVLEVSVGTGANISLLPDRASYYGLDLSWAMLTQCQKNLLKWEKGMELFYGNAELLPYRDEMFDVVFHVGGINAFNDRSKAINEMIRVARSGTRIVIVDETSKMMEKLRWMPSARKMIEEWGDRFESPVEFVPDEMEEVRSETIINDYFYILSFRKP